jgi:4'-phosphopantetheinyl transferase
MIANRLHTGTVRVRWLSLEDCPQAYIVRCRAFLDAAETAQADRFHFAADRNAYIAAHGLLRVMLSEAAELGPALWRFVNGTRGKPMIAPGLTYESIQFNISHTRGIVACALVRHFNIGLDLEVADRWRGDYATVCGNFCSDEATLVLEAPPSRRSDLFFRLWTLKESFVKATGEGLHRPLNSFSFQFDPVRIVLHSVSGNAGYRAEASHWQFAEFHPAPHRLLAVTVGCGHARVSFDASAMHPDAIASWFG